MEIHYKILKNHSVQSKKYCLGLQMNFELILC